MFSHGIFLVTARVNCGLFHLNIPVLRGMWQSYRQMAILRHDSLACGRHDTCRVMASPMNEWTPVGTPQNTDSSFEMAESSGHAQVLPNLQSSKSTRRLEQITELRARGVGKHIGLPQLVVCGDQSAGKSSVLEGITGIPFPRNDGLCTKFATEIILQHSAEELRITATILPAVSRSDMG
jgi:Dynamin family